MFRVNWLRYFYFQLPKQDPENPSPTCSAFKASKQAVKIKRRRVSKGKGKWSSRRDKFKIMQNPRCKKASLCWLNLQHTCHTTVILYFPKGITRCFNLPKVQREFCERATNQQKEKGGRFSSFLTEFPFYLTFKGRQQFIGNVSVGMERSLSKDSGKGAK